MSLPNPLPDEVRPSRDPRDDPGTDDHDRLVHPHGNALWFPWPYIVDDLPGYVLASVAAHAALSADYLAHAARRPLPPLCRDAHVEILAGVNDLPHAMRGKVAGMLAEFERDAGKSYGLLRVWRHFGLDCDAAEAWRCGDPGAAADS